MKDIKRPRLSLVMCFVCCILALLGIGVVSVFLPGIVYFYADGMPDLTRPVPIIITLYVALAVAAAVVVLLLRLLGVVRAGQVFTPISSRLVEAIAWLVIAEGFVFAVLGLLAIQIAFGVFFVAVTMGLCLMVVRTVLKDAAALKEENDGTI